jgi:hypothetical protein
MHVFPSLKCFTHFEHCSHPCTHFHKHAQVSGEFLQQGFPLSEKFDDSTLAKRHIVVGHFVSSDTGHVMQAIDVTRHSRITRQLVPSTTILSFICYSQFACKKKLLMTFGTTLVLLLQLIIIIIIISSSHSSSSILCIIPDRFCCVTATLMWLTPSCFIILENLVVIKLVKKFLRFLEPRVLLSYLPKPLGQTGADSVECRPVYQVLFI